MSNYHEILGVDSNATKEEIRKAYLKKVKELHPDKPSNKGKEKQCNEKMAKVQEAYDYLYLGKGPQQQEFGGSHQHGGAEGFGQDVFDQFFNHVFNFKNVYSVEIKLRDFFTKDNITVELQDYKVCNYCRGSGCMKCFYRGKTATKQKVVIDYKNKKYLFDLLNNNIKHTLDSGSSIVLQLGETEYFIDTRKQSLTVGLVITHRESLDGVNISGSLFNEKISFTIPPKTDSHKLISSSGVNLYWSQFSKLNIYGKIIIVHRNSISLDERIVEFNKA